ncbi:MAG TPA: glycosyltransferase family 4 protein, partial [Vicinamibacterales bacterium]|nr:glycosyltransferase family 4 protein [Vicinamibacterales bacterium]
FVIRSAQVGGVEQHVIDLIQSLRGQYSIELVTLTDEAPHESFARLGIPLHQLKGHTVQRVSSLSNLGDLVRKFKELAPDIVHLHGIRPIFFGAVAARVAHVRKIVATFHSSHRLMAMNDAGVVQPLKLLVSKVMHCVGLACSTHSIAVSRNLEQELHRILRQCLLLPYWINRRKLHVIYNGMALERFSREPTRPPPPSTKEMTIGYVGRLDPKKGAEYLIEAVHLLIARGCRVKLVLVGTGWYRERLEPLVARLGIADRVEFLGHRNDVMTLARDFDVFVLPSLSEGMPLTIIEMMAVGVPVIATRVGGIPEQIEDGVSGLLVEVRNSQQIAEQIWKLLHDPQLAQRMTRAARERALRLFDDRVMFRSLESLYGD